MISCIGESGWGIKYTNHRFFKSWKSLLHYDESINHWNVLKLRTYNEAKEIIDKLNTIDDINKWYKDEHKKIVIKW